MITAAAALALALVAAEPAPGRLPEDPAAGKKSEAQWQQHMEAEERERQLGYDRRKIREHRKTMKLLAAARARYDRARTAAAVARVRATMSTLREQLRARETAIDHWGVNSRLLADYEATIAALEGAYPDAKVAALSGDGQPLRDLRAELDRRTKKMNEWLTEAAASEDE